MSEEEEPNARRDGPRGACVLAARILFRYSNGEVRTAVAVHVTQSRNGPTELLAAREDADD